MYMLMISSKQVRGISYQRSEIMVEWIKLGDVASYYRGVTYNKKQEVSLNSGGTKILRANNITLETNSLNYDDIKEIDSSVKIRDDQWLYPKDILICAGSGSKEHIGKVSFIKESIGYAYGGFMGKIVTKPILNSKYLFHILCGSLFKDYLKTALNSTTINNLNSEIINNFQIPMPTLSEQERIVGILDTFTSSIDNLKQQIAQRRKQYEYYRCCLFSTEKWPENKIGELTKIFSCPRVFKDQWQDSGVPFWRSSDIMSYHNGVINPRGEVYISQSLYEELSSKSDKIKEGDILVTGGGSIGIPYLKKDNSPLFVKDADLICIQKCTSIIPKYLYHYFLSTDFKMYLKRITHDATIAHYTINQIKDTPILLPPLSEQQRIVSILDTFEASIRNLEAQLSQREKQYEYYRNKLLTFE